MATRVTVLRNTGLIAEAGQTVAKGTDKPKIKFARYTTKAGDPRVLRNLEVLKVKEAAENGLLIAVTKDPLGNIRSYNTGRLTHTQVTTL